MADVFGMQNQFYLGNFQQVVTDASAFNPRGEANAKLECDIILNRAYVAMGNHFLVLQKINSDAPISLQAVKLLATYMQSPEQLPNYIDQINAWMSTEAATDNTLLVVAAMIYNREGQYEEALKFIGQNPATLEQMAILVQTYLQMHRVDLAEKTWTLMQQKEDDATLTQLAAAWVNLAKGGDRIQKALFGFTDLAEKYGTTLNLLNGMAACHMSKGEFDDAHKLLQQSLDKNPQDVDALINLVVCLQHLGTYEELVTTTISTLQNLHPGHPWVKNMAQMEDSFARIAGA